MATVIHIFIVEKWSFFYNHLAHQRLINTLARNQQRKAKPTCKCISLNQWILSKTRMKLGGGIVSALWWVLSLCWPPLTASLLEICLSMSQFKSMMEMTQVNAYLTHYLLLNILFKPFLVLIMIIIDKIWFCFTVKKVKNFYVHSKYNVNARKAQGVEEFYDYDVALIQLEKSVQISILAR